MTVRIPPGVELGGQERGALGRLGARRLSVLVQAGLLLGAPSERLQRDDHGGRVPGVPRQRQQLLRGGLPVLSLRRRLRALHEPRALPRLLQLGVPAVAADHIGAVRLLHHLAGVLHVPPPESEGVQSGQPDIPDHHAARVRDHVL